MYELEAMWALEAQRTIVALEYAETYRDLTAAELAELQAAYRFIA